MSVLQLPAKYFFGKNILNNNLATFLKQIKAKKVCLLYGKGSIKKNGVYDKVYHECKKAKITCVEFSGIEPNPRNLTIDKAIAFVKQTKVDVIIAAGGGSVIDASKVIAALATNPQYKDCWSYIQDPSKLTKPPLKIISIITLAATGSENNGGSVITNAQTQIKTSVGNNDCIPIGCFEDPTYTTTAPWYQICSGIFDIFSHLLEQYFDEKSLFAWTKQYIFANLKTLLAQTKILVKDHKNYDALANILWTSSWALNSLANFNNGQQTGWLCHRMEHAISGKWDVAHGMGLALVTPIFLKYMTSKNKRYRDLTLDLAKEVFEVNTLPLFFKKLIEFINDLSAPKKLTDFDLIKSVNKDDIKWLFNHYLTVYHPKKDSADYKNVKAILNLLPW
ncbi:MAG: iron-containing alcohol dehydrogenase [Mycoplasmataceae bacterium]|nr:iron-containing alcohol dehydrogenase [Mycoplasmataceae bacterium]